LRRLKQRVGGFIAHLTGILLTTAVLVHAGALASNVTATSIPRSGPPNAIASIHTGLALQTAGLLHLPLMHSSN